LAWHCRGNEGGRPFGAFFGETETDMRMREHAGHAATVMVHCVEQRFGTIRAPHPVQWLSDNGSIFAARKIVEIAVALNLVPCFTPVESPESNGMAEAFVKTFKRDYVRDSPIPDAAAALALVDSWMEDYNTVHPHSRLGYRSPREYTVSQPVACPA
jgi:putative transposase